MDVVNQFDIYWVDLNPTVGSEINKKRPCTVISPNEMNRNLNTVIVAPLTSTIKTYPTRVQLVVNGKKGQVVLDQIRTIDKRRLGNKIKVLDKKAIAQVKEVLSSMFK